MNRRTLIAAACLLLPLPLAAQERVITIASSTGPEHSGLFGHILPTFTDKTGIGFRISAVGTGRALDLGRRGEADVVFVHDRATEEQFIAEGYGVARHEVMYNDFIIVGPAADPAGARGNDAADALRRIAAAGAPFASRGDRSGTHAAELRLWREAGIEPAGPWYHETGSGTGATLEAAAAMNGYAWADRASWLPFRGRDDMTLLVEGDPRMVNQYSIILVNPARHGHVRAADGHAFIDWLVSPAGQAAIGSFRIAGEKAYFPNAHR
jgi:tungstate transport system substrate-binding protein